MKSIRRPIAFALIFALAASVSQSMVHAQYYYYNPYAAYAQAQYAQQMWNAQAMQRSYYANPGYSQNYNYYANPSMAAATLAPMAAASSFSPGDPYASSMGSTMAASAASGYGLSQGAYGSPYNLYNPYGGLGSSSGYQLMGVADVNRSYGQMLSTIEQARMTREQYNQARIETRKKQFEFDLFVKANTPSYTEQQAQAAKDALKRLQTNSQPGEIASARALNYLLNDLDKYKNKKSTSEPIPLSEAVLTKMNVTTKTYGIGVLRDEGRLIWPSALKDLQSVKERENLDTRVQTLVKNAKKGQIDDNVLADVCKELDDLRKALVSKVNDIQTRQYLEAKRFLQEFDEATIALKNGEVANQEKYQRFIEGGRSVQDVADYLLHQSLRFGPATSNDEGAYRTLYSALASHDIAVNATVVVAGAKD